MVSACAGVCSLFLSRKRKTEHEQLGMRMKDSTRALTCNTNSPHQFISLTRRSLRLLTCSSHLLTALSFLSFFRNRKTVHINPQLHPLPVFFCVLNFPLFATPFTTLFLSLHAHALALALSNSTVVYSHNNNTNKSIMYISWPCTAIRLAPIGVLILVHCSRGHWPSDQEAMERAMDYGFSVDLFPERPTSVLTHLFVHVSTEHLVSNIFTLAATLMEFGGITMRANVEEGREEVAAQRSIGSFIVMVVGGVIGGLGGQLLYNDSKLRRRRDEVSRLRFEAAHNGQDVGQVLATSTSNFFHGVGDTISSALHLGSGSGEGAAVAPQAVESGLIGGVKNKVNSWRWNWRIWSASAKADVQEGINNSMLMCGASAGICALAGFNLTYFFRPITTMCVVVPEIGVLAYEMWERYSTAVEENLSNGTQSSSGEGGWRTLLPGQTVGHAAHVGGFAVGAVMGLLWRRRMLRRKNAVNSQST